MKMRKYLSPVREIPSRWTPSTMQSVSSSVSMVPDAQTWHHLNLVAPPSYNTLAALDNEPPPSYEDYIKNSPDPVDIYPKSKAISDNSDQVAHEVCPPSTEEENTN